VHLGILGFYFFQNDLQDPLVTVMCYFNRPKLFYHLSPEPFLISFQKDDQFSLLAQECSVVMAFKDVCYHLGQIKINLPWLVAEVRVNLFAMSLL
jgi:hypothetical protein